MLCPYCGNGDTKVVDSRPDSLGRLRRRRCGACGHGFTTTERIAAEDLLVKKRDGSVEPFSRAKLIKGINKAASVYALSPADVNAFVDRILQALQPTAPGLPVPSVEIGRLVLQQLQDGRATTDVARIRYAIVFLGATTRLGRFRGLRDLLNWLEEVYGPQPVNTPVRTPLTVIKRNGRVEPFELRKLERSIGIAAKGRGTDQEVHGLASRLAGDAMHQLTRQALVTSQQIAAEVLKLLRTRDHMAYLRYASAVKHYRSVGDFWLEALGLQSDDT